MIRRRHRFLLAGAVAALAFTGCAGNQPRATPAREATASTTTAAVTTTMAGSATSTVAATQPEPPASGPSTTVPSRRIPGALEIVDPNIELPAGRYISSFGLRNVGGEPMKWTAVRIPTPLVLESTVGTLHPEEFVPVLVTVNPSSLPPGPFRLTFQMSANDTLTSVTVTGTKT